jgi:hypothetical protein
MNKPSTTVQRGLSGALLELLRSPDLSPEDVKWVQQFALRTIAEFSVMKSQENEKEAPESRLQTLGRYSSFQSD